MEAWTFPCIEQLRKSEKENCSRFALVFAHTVALFLLKKLELNRSWTYLHIYTHIGEGSEEQW